MNGSKGIIKELWSMRSEAILVFIVLPLMVALGRDQVDQSYFPSPPEAITFAIGRSGELGLFQQ
jgi:hypothetical protein